MLAGDLLAKSGAGHVLAASGNGNILAASGEGAKAGPIGLGVILLLCIACYFLFKSMSKHMRNVRENFPSELPPDPAQSKPQSPISAESSDQDRPARE